jgi:inosine-uridine nucleoside N-ribohydrolase
MGGAIGLGNWSPAAEFNLLVDPEAAAIVFNCGIRVNVIPLEVSHTVLITEEIFEEFAKMKSDFSKKLTKLMRYFQVRYKESQNFEFPVAHDPCTIYFLLHP